MQRVNKRRAGQTAVEYIMLLAVVVGVSYALKTPMSRMLTQFFGGFSTRAVTATRSPTVNNYSSNGARGCAAVGRGGGGGCE